jgi:hypothetical protein
MPSTIVFDTNYLRSLSMADYLAGRLPPVLEDLVRKAAARGDLIAIPHTVRQETNAWLASKSDKDWGRLVDARQLLEQHGCTVTPATHDKPAHIDIVDVFRKVNPGLAVFTPALDDYAEAERRTSYRIPPNGKSLDDEEMRDRIIWCQLLRHAKLSKTPILIVSRDTLFKNGVALAEGIEAQIELVEDGAELAQRLDARPPHIQELVNQLLAFEPELLKQHFVVRPQSIQLIENLRKMNMGRGIVLKMFTLRTAGVEGFEPVMEAFITSMEQMPLSLVFLRKDEPIIVNRTLTDDEKRMIGDQVVQAATAIEVGMRELQSIVRS